MNSADRLIDKIVSLVVNPILGLLTAFALLYFIWGVIEYIKGVDNEDTRTKGKQHMIWGIVGLFIMTSFAGLMKIIQNFVASF